VARALLVPRVRRATTPTRGSIEQRLTSKKRQGARKQERRRDFDD
jgi:ribosome-associated protein